MRLTHVTLPSRDVPRGVAFYQRLGFTLIVDSAPRYARLELPEDGATLSLEHVEVAPGSPGVVTFLECADLDATVAGLTAAGVTFESGPKDEPWRWREARLRDPDGNALCLFQPGDNRRFPPWRVGGAKPSTP